MSLSLSIVDQHVNSLAERQKSRFESKEFRATNPEKRRSLAFVALAVKTFLDLSEDEAIERLTEGGNDFAVDAIDCTSASDGEFTVTLFQGKYKAKNPESSKFPRGAVEKMLLAVHTLFDPDKEVTLNDRLRPRIEEVRSLVRDGAIPQVRVVLCNNGERWDTEAEELIRNARLGGQVSWSHVNHDAIIEVLKSSKAVEATLNLTGKAVVESFDFRRVLVGRISVSELARVFREHGDRLLQRNIRRYLGLSGNEVNKAIDRTLRASEEQPNFYFYNNGVTVTCDKFSHNELQASAWPVRLTNMQVINGGQTCKTIEHVLSEPGLDASRASVLVRIYELPNDGDRLVRSITYATNSQSPVDLRDLMSNDSIQQRLELSLRELGYEYRRARSEATSRPTDITSATAAEAVLAVWRHQPHQAKFRTTEHFGRLYPTIFTEQLNGAQVILAVLLFRIAENHRKRLDEETPDFLHYASCFLAMEMGKQLLTRLGLTSGDTLDHHKFPAAEKLIKESGEEFYAAAVSRIDTALERLYGRERGQIKLQRLAATFRRGDLIEELRALTNEPNRGASLVDTGAIETVEDQAGAAPPKQSSKQTRMRKVRTAPEVTAKKPLVSKSATKKGAKRVASKPEAGKTRKVKRVASSRTQSTKKDQAGSKKVTRHRSTVRR